MSPQQLVLVATWLVLSGTSLSCSRGSKETEGRASGGMASVPIPTTPASSAAGAAGVPEVPAGDPVSDGGVRSCSRAGWSSIPALGTDCPGVCSPAALSLVPKLEFASRPNWCEGCLFLQTPWAKATPEAAVAGGVRAFGAGPDWLNLGLWLENGKSGIVGIYDASLSPTAGFFVDTPGSRPCGKLASIKFSTDGELGAQLETRLGEVQRVYATATNGAANLLSGEARFTWPQSVLGERAINDMWFSAKRVAMDLFGSVWIGDPTSGSAIEVAKLPDAPKGEYSHARVVDDDVFVSSWNAGRTRWFFYAAGALRPLLGDASKDARDFVTDGEVMVWLEGSGASASPDGLVRFSRYDLMKSPYSTDQKTLAPTLLAANVPMLSNLVLANGRVVGIYQPDPSTVRAAAFVVELGDGQQYRSELPNHYSWGYELYPAEQELWGAITTGPMINFETVARVPYSQMQGL